MKNISTALAAIIVAGLAGFATSSVASAATPADAAGYESLAQRQVPVQQGREVQFWGHTFYVN